MDLFVTIDGDSIGSKIGRARLNDDADLVRRLSQKIDQGNAIFTAWAVNVGGSVIEVGGDEITIQIPASKINAIEALRQQYLELVGASVSVGVGIKISDSSKALLVAKLRGKDRVVFYTPDLEEEIAAAQKEDANSKIIHEYLSKAGANDIAPPSAVDFAPQLHQFAQATQQKDLSNAIDTNARRDQIKQDIVGILQTIKQQAPVLAQLQKESPEIFDSIQRLIQGVIAIGRELSVDNMQKSTDEELEAGIAVEMEHTQDVNVARKIALDHLKEDPKYYTKLKAAGLAKIATPFQVDPATKTKLPVGSVVGDKLAVANENGEKRWKQVEAGLIASSKPGPLGTLKPTSSDSPNT